MQFTPAQSFECFLAETEAQGAYSPFNFRIVFQSIQGKFGYSCGTGFLTFKATLPLLGIYANCRNIALLVIEVIIASLRTRQSKALPTVGFNPPNAKSNDDFRNR